MSDDLELARARAKARLRLRQSEEIDRSDIADESEANTTSAVKYGLGFTEGVGEFLNVPAIPGALERAGRTAYGVVTEPREPGEGLLGKIARVGSEADREAILPMPSVGETASGVRAFGRSILSPTKTAQIYEEEAQAQKEYEKEFISPGARTAGLIASAVPGVVAGGKAIIAGAKGLKATGQAAIKTAQKFTKTGELVDNTPAILKEVLQQTDGEIVEAILKRPEQVKELIARNQFSVDDLAKTLLSKLNETKETLGTRVRQFRDVAQADTTRSIQQVEGLSDGLRAVLAKSDIRGVSMLPANEKRMLEAIIQIGDEALISPQEALKAVDAIDAIVDYGKAGKSGSKFIQSANYALKGARRALKDSVRSASPDASEWAIADDAYGYFIEPSEEIIRKLNGSNRNSFVSGLFNKNKEPVVEQLSQALGLVPDGELGSYKQVFFNKLADIKAAGALKARELRQADPIADNAARIIAKYEKMGERVGGLAGAVTGSLGGTVFGPIAMPGIAGSGGGVTGALGGKYIGGLIGRTIGVKKADPMRLLDIAIESKNKDVASLAKDLKPILKEGGEAAVQAVLMSIGPSRVVQELFQTIQSSQSNGEK